LIALLAGKTKSENWWRPSCIFRAPPVESGGEVKPKKTYKTKEKKTNKNKNQKKQKIDHRVPF
jgi:hypothetical protein